MKTRWIGLRLLLVALPLLAACSEPPAPTATPTLQIDTPEPTPTATSAPPVTYAQELVICTSEPEAASPFLPSQAGSDILALFYEEPVERVGYLWEPRLVERVPSPEAGDVNIRSVPVTLGTRYADPLGLVLQYTRTESSQLPQLVVTFTLKSGLRWSDGEPIAARDAVLGYHLAQSPQAQGRWRQLVERTARFVAVDEQRLRWEGIPGYLDTDYPGFLFPLQPAHRWQGQGLENILQDRTPPATGPFEITAWESGREVRLEPNPYYSGSAPTLEEITVRFPQQNPDSWSGLLAGGACDVVLPDPIILTPIQPWGRLAAEGQATLWADIAPVMLRLDFNLDPATDVPAPTEDSRVREAIARCVNRGALTEELPTEALAPATGFIPPNHPAFEGSDEAAYDPQAAGRLLDEAGWRDTDGDGMREAVDVTGFTDGDPLSLALHLPSQYLVTAAHIATDLETCGIRANLQPTDLRQLYTQDPASPLFGRTFQMTLIGWQAEVPQICGAWLSQRVPEADNSWMGENFSGYTSGTYDEACSRALSTIDRQEQTEALRTAGRLLEISRPSAFLVWRPFWFAARPQVRGLQPDASAYGTLWNIEDVSIGDPVPQE
ncbi:MAG: ABC transporter substrate-binding protein [Anaerolineae bacterium]